MVGSHFRGHQLFARGFAHGKFLADLGFFIVRNARSHRTRRQEHRWQIAKGRCRHDEARHDLVADAEIEGGIEGVVRQAHACGERNHIAAEERQLHPRLALSDAIAHGRNPARHLRRGASLAGRFAD